MSRELVRGLLACGVKESARRELTQHRSQVYQADPLTEPWFSGRRENSKYSWVPLTQTCPSQSLVAQVTAREHE